MVRRIFPSKFNSTCYECGEPIQAGQLIVWERDDDGDTASWHQECDRTPNAPTEPNIGPRAEKETK